MLNIRSLFLLLLSFSSVTAWANCTDIGILADYGVIGENEFDYGRNSTINGNNITGGGNTPTPTGTTQTIDVNFPSIDPAQFPATGGADLDDPAVVAAGSYGTIEFKPRGQNNTITFSGGNYFIEKLELDNQTTVVFAPGNYFIEEADIGNGFNLIIAPEGPVSIHIGDEFKVDQNAIFNSLGNTGDLIFYLHNDAEFEVGRANQGSTAPDFNGIIYSPFADSKVEFENNNNITGAILSAGEVEVGNNTSFDYSDDVKADVLEALGCTPVTGPDHYHIGHSGIGITCEPSIVTLTAHNADHSAFTATTNLSLAVSTSPSVNLISPAVATIVSGSSSTTVQISQFSVTASPHINININAGMAGTPSETSGSADADPNSVNYDDPRLQFVDSAFVFTVLNVADPFGTPLTTLPPQIGGKPTSSPPLNRTMTIRAVRASDAQLNRQCEPALDAGVHNLQLGYRCSASAGCSSSDLKFSNSYSFNAGTAATLAHNVATATSNTTTVPIDFDFLGDAPISFRYDNVGAIQLFVKSYTLNGATINGNSSNEFVVWPFALALDFGDSQDADGDAFDMRQDDVNNGGLNGSNNDISYSNSSATGTPTPPNSTVFTSAGTDFPVEISAVLWQQADDLNANGLADTGANIYDNPVATLFGKEGSLPNLAFGHALKSPAGGISGNLLTSFPGPYSGGKTVGTMNWDEVGIIDISVSLGSYLGSSLYSAASTALDVGRFRPAYFSISGNSIQHRSDLTACTSNFTYMDESFNLAYDLHARSLAGGDTRNYTSANGYAHLDTLGELNFQAIDVLIDPVTLALTATDVSGRLSAHPPITFTNGIAAVSSPMLLTRPGIGVPGAPLNVSFGIAPDDGDGVTLQSVADSNGDSLPDAGLVASGAIFRDGRLALKNVFGSELNPLIMPMRTEYFDGANYIVNGDDNCTQIVSAGLNPTFPAGLTSTLTVLNSPSAAGVLNVQLSPPGAGNTGTITLNPVVPGWLQFDWSKEDVAAGEVPVLENPSASANFGIYQGNSRQIYYRQLFR
jgi:MSHA biogenesis protein MshQ